MHSVHAAYDAAFINTLHQGRTLIRGDNLEEMRKCPDETFDIIATDPPFNSKRDYFVPYRDEHGKEPDTLVKAFTDTWTWGPAAARTCEELICDVGGKIGEVMEGLSLFLKDTPMLAYLSMMAIRLVEMRRILKPTGSIYLHCDATASHYLKLIMDAVFGQTNFRNEIVWHYRRWTAASKQFQKMHDVIFWYSKTAQYLFTKPLQAYANEKYIEDTVRGVVDGKVVRLRGEDGNYIKRETQREGVLMHDVWEDINFIAPTAKERVGYPTQKPIALYKRILQASSNEGDLVLDPFCGCGTTLIAAEELNRRWLGIDLTYLATGAVKLQVEKFFPQLADSIVLTGTPENAEMALRLAREKPHDFEEWCVTHVLKFKSNAKKGADGGIDGTYRFPIGKVKGRNAYGKMVAQVKGGNFTLDQVRAFRTAMANAGAELGIFVVTKPPTAGMQQEALLAGTWQHPVWDMAYPRLQFYLIQEHFEGRQPQIPVGERHIL